MNGINGEMPMQNYVDMQPATQPGLVERMSYAARIAAGTAVAGGIALASVYLGVGSGEAPAPVTPVELVPGDHIPCDPNIPTTTTEEGCNPHKTTPESTTTTTPESTTTTAESTTTTSESTTTTVPSSTTTEAPTTTRPADTTTTTKQEVPGVPTTVEDKPEVVTG